MSTKLVSLKVRAMKRLEQAQLNREAGQGALEYVGMVAVAAVVVTLLITAASSWDLGSLVSGAITKVKTAAG